MFILRALPSAVFLSSAERSDSGTGRKLLCTWIHVTVFENNVTFAPCSFVKRPFSFRNFFFQLTPKHHRIAQLRLRAISPTVALIRRRRRIRSGSAIKFVKFLSSGATYRVSATSGKRKRVCSCSYPASTVSRMSQSVH